MVTWFQIIAIFIPLPLWELGDWLMGRYGPKEDLDIQGDW